MLDEINNMLHGVSLAIHMSYFLVALAALKGTATDVRIAVFGAYVARLIGCVRLFCPLPFELGTYITCRGTYGVFCASADKTTRPVHLPSTLEQNLLCNI